MSVCVCLCSRRRCVWVCSVVAEMIRFSGVGGVTVVAVVIIIIIIIGCVGVCINRNN